MPKEITLAMIKMEKNFVAQTKGYPRRPYDEYSLGQLTEKLHEECTELVRALIMKNFAAAKRECADVSNVVDYIFEALAQKTKTPEAIKRD